LFCYWHYLSPPTSFAGTQHDCKVTNISANGKILLSILRNI
jgi:hypothetical protein